MKPFIIAVLIFLASSAALAVLAHPVLGGRTVNEKGQYGVIFKMVDERVWVRNTNSEGQPTWPVEVPYDEIFLIEGRSKFGFEHGDEVSFNDEDTHFTYYGRVVGVTVRNVLLIRLRETHELVKIEGRRVRSTGCDADLGGD